MQIGTLLRKPSPDFRVESPEGTFEIVSRKYLTGADNDELSDELQILRDIVQFSTAFFDVDHDRRLQLEDVAIKRLQPRMNIRGRLWKN